MLGRRKTRRGLSLIPQGQFIGFLFGEFAFLAEKKEIKETKARVLRTAEWRNYGSYDGKMHFYLLVKVMFLHLRIYIEICFSTSFMVAHPHNWIFRSFHLQFSGAVLLAFLFSAHLFSVFGVHDGNKQNCIQIILILTHWLGL